jgi:hypothetical protein
VNRPNRLDEFAADRNVATTWQLIDTQAYLRRGAMDLHLISRSGSGRGGAFGYAATPGCRRFV